MSPPDMNEVIAQAQQMQAKMAEMQDRLAETEVTGASGGGMLEVTLNGKGEMREVKIDPVLVNPNEIAVLEDLIVAATNDAKAKVEAQVAQKMGELTGGLGLPPGFKLPF